MHDDVMRQVPDFIIIGTMKSATTTLFQWLSEVPQIEMPATKEPAFFADNAVWAEGYAWYQDLFPRLPPPMITGEASVVYSDPRYSSTAAERIAATLPGVRIICLLRDPVERLRSNYRHEVRRHRESRPFLEAIADPSTAYVRRSCYYSALAPYLDRFEPAQLLIVPMAETVTAPFAGWYEVLSHLQVPAVPPAGVAINVTANMPRFSGSALWLWERGVLDKVARCSPRWVRRTGRQVFMRDTAVYRELFASAEAPIPPPMLEHLYLEVDLLEEAIGRSLEFRRFQQ